jgi:two-component system phosphate regulon sensor histidine kinase PhoR
MNKFRVRLTLIFIALIVFSVLAISVIAAKLLERSHVDALRDHMVRELQVIMGAIDWQQVSRESTQRPYLAQQAANWKQLTSGRLTFIHNDGVVLADSDHDPSTMDNHLSREEIQTVIYSSEPGKSIRFSDTLQQDMLYVAIAAPVEKQTSLGFVRLSMSLNDVEASVFQFWQYLIIGFTVLAIVTGAISYRLAYSLTKPIEMITKVAQRITHREYNARVNFRRRDEIGQLSQAINTMATSLQLQMSRIVEDESRLQIVLDNMVSGIVVVDLHGRVVLLNRATEDLLGCTSNELVSKIFSDTHQQVELTKLVEWCLETREHVRDEILLFYPEERVIDVNATPISDADGQISGVIIVLHNITALRKLERMRSEFVANVSHELKTPIASVKGFAETLLAGALNDKETARSFLQIIYDESERLNRLIGDILDLSKIESKRIPLHFSPVELDSFMGRTIKMLQEDARSKRIELVLRVQEELYVEADEDRLRQIINNLVQNGINYTPEGGRVTVSVDAIGEPESAEERIRIVVADTGIGIPKKDLPRIFERFYRVDKARSRSSGGTGLGLSIVKHLIELHHGTISVDSQVGVGSHFTIELPVLQ